VPARYARANIFELTANATDANYAAATDTLLSCYAPSRFREQNRGCFSRQPYRQGAIFAIVGPRGTGKTHLACALVHLFQTADPPRSPLYRRALEIFAEIKGTWAQGASRTEADIIAELQTAPLLVIDEVQVRSESAFENARLTTLIDSRYAELRPTILVSNLSPADMLDSLGDSVESRIIESGAIIEATWPSFRTAGKAATPAA